jgi:hypothetical protein
MQKLFLLYLDPSSNFFPLLYPFAYSSNSSVTTIKLQPFSSEGIVLNTEFLSVDAYKWEQQPAHLVINHHV